MGTDSAKKKLMDKKKGVVKVNHGFLQQLWAVLIPWKIYLVEFNMEVELINSDFL